MAPRADLSGSAGVLDTRGCRPLCSSVMLDCGVCPELGATPAVAARPPVPRRHVEAL